MEPQTNGANTKDWLEAIKEYKINAYIDNYMPTQSMHGVSISTEGFYDEMLKVYVQVPVHPAVFLEHEIKMELDAWDILSDEALSAFELEI